MGNFIAQVYCLPSTVEMGGKTQLPLLHLPLKSKSNNPQTTLGSGRSDALRPWNQRDIERVARELRGTEGPEMAAYDKRLSKRRVSVCLLYDK